MLEFPNVGMARTFLSRVLIDSLELCKFEKVFGGGEAQTEVEGSKPQEFGTNL